MALLYGLFIWWHTSFNGPLSDDEFQGYLRAARAARTEPLGTPDAILDVMKADGGRNFHAQPH